MTPGLVGKDASMTGWSEGRSGSGTEQACGEGRAGSSQTPVVTIVHSKPRDPLRTPPSGPQPSILLN
jgi:hypothetical protein